VLSDNVGGSRKATAHLIAKSSDGLSEPEKCGFYP
jgi:hypothetical protein